MVELIAAVALAPWAQPLRFRPLPGWQAGTNGTFSSSYGPVPDVASPKESTAWMVRGVRYRDARTADPPEATLSQLPRGGIVVFATIYQAAQNAQRRIDLRFEAAKRYPCCDGTYVAGGEYALAGCRTRRIFRDRPRLLRLVPDAVTSRTGTARDRPSRAALASVIARATGPLLVRVPRTPTLSLLARVWRIVRFS